MQRALDSAIGLPSRSTSASWMLVFLMPAEVRRSLKMPPVSISAEGLRRPPTIIARRRMPEHRCDALRRLPSLVSRPQTCTVPQSRSYAVCTGVCTVRALAGSAGHARTRTRGCKYPCVQTRTPHGDGVCGTSSLCRAKPMRMEKFSSRELRMPTQEVGGSDPTVGRKPGGRPAPQETTDVFSQRPGAGSSDQRAVGVSGRRA